MKICFTSAALLTCLVISFGACGIHTAVPGFKYPAYNPDTKWPALSPIQDLENTADIKLDAILEEIEALQRLIR